MARRRSRRRRVFVASGILLLLLLGATVYVLNQEFARITTVQVFDPDSLSAEKQESLVEIAERAMRGSYIGIVPRNSIFFFPASRIRFDILTMYPDIAAVSLFRGGLRGLSLRIATRVPIAQWCGAAPTTPAEDCYFFDASGVLYATTTTDQSVNSFRFYEIAAAPVFGATLPNAHTFPAAFDFARQLTTFGSSVTTVVFRDEEVDDYLASGTRITYVRGNEQNAFTALTSVHESLNLVDGSLDYVDLRFNGKVYLKKRSSKQ